MWNNRKEICFYVSARNTTGRRRRTTRVLRVNSKTWCCKDIKLNTRHEYVIKPRCPSSIFLWWGSTPKGTLDYTRPSGQACKKYKRRSGENSRCVSTLFFSSGYVAFLWLAKSVVSVSILSFILTATVYKLQQWIKLWIVKPILLGSTTFTTAGSKFYLVPQRYTCKKCN